jgi:hypothetical protein
MISFIFLFVTTNFQMRPALRLTGETVKIEASFLSKIYLSQTVYSSLCFLSIQTNDC